MDLIQTCILVFYLVVCILVFGWRSFARCWCSIRFGLTKPYWSLWWRFFCASQSTVTTVTGTMWAISKFSEMPYGYWIRQWCPNWPPSCYCHDFLPFHSTYLPSTSSSPSTSSNFSGNSLWIPPNLSYSIFAAQVVDRQAYKSNTWIIGTGATDHMVHSVAQLTSITSIVHTFVYLPNGEQALVT